MNQKIVILSGKRNCGKTTTIKLIYKLLLKKHPNAKKVLEKTYGDDVLIVLNINEKIIGISSQGDHKKYVEKHLKTLMDENCSLILTATRTREGTIEAVKHYCPPFQMKRYIQKYPDKNNYISSNQEIAEEIVLFISNEISAE